MKIIISKEEGIPFRSESWELMQMLQHKVRVTVTQWEDETDDWLEKKLDDTFNREIKKALSEDSVYQKQNKQLKYLVEIIKKELPGRYKEIITNAKKLWQK